MRIFSLRCKDTTAQRGVSPFCHFLKKQHLRLSLYFTEIDAGVFLLKILLVSGKLFEE